MLLRLLSNLQSTSFSQGPGVDLWATTLSLEKQLSSIILFRGLLYPVPILQPEFPLSSESTTMPTLRQELDPCYLYVYMSYMYAGQTHVRKWFQLPGDETVNLAETILRVSFALPTYSVALEGFRSCLRTLECQLACNKMAFPPSC